MNSAAFVLPVSALSGSHRTTLSSSTIWRPHSTAARRRPHHQHLGYHHPRRITHGRLFITTMIPSSSSLSTTPQMAANAGGPSSSKNDQQQPSAQDLAKLYGGSYLGTSIGMSIVSFSVLYALVYIGVDVRSLTNGFGNWLATTPLGRPAALDNVSDAASAAAIAYVAHKVTSPLRFPLTIAATPLVARIFSEKKKNDNNNDDSTQS